MTLFRRISPGIHGELEAIQTGRRAKAAAKMLQVRGVRSREKPSGKTQDVWGGRKGHLMTVEKKRWRQGGEEGRRS